uniref:Uncharacterized protein n=1 Tax=Utricularia reniformis TaxID=192314 RepID=A0A1Y0B1F9_9LAMI|nr:hypothetical protein AEK19_MT0964 [Utricularia reniformis]ART31189.1 hypothetical protein AEK19_MT0964 [Utricularia reniformis]
MGVEYFVQKFPHGEDPMVKVFGLVKSKQSPTLGLGFLYFCLMDLYLEFADLCILENIYGLSCCFWRRSLTTSLVLQTMRRLPLNIMRYCSCILSYRPGG